MKKSNFKYFQAIYRVINYVVEMWSPFIVLLEQNNSYAMTFWEKSINFIMTSKDALLQQMMDCGVNKSHFQAN